MSIDLQAIKAELARPVDPAESQVERWEAYGRVLVPKLVAEVDRVTVEAEAVREENDRLHKLVDDLRQGDGHQVCRTELGRVTAERDQARAEAATAHQFALGAEASRNHARAELANAKTEADRATQMWSHAEADAQVARPIVRAAQDWRAEIAADKTLQEAWGGHPLAVAVDRHGELDNEQGVSVEASTVADQLADIERRVALDQEVFAAAEALVQRMKQSVGDSSSSASQWLDPYSYRLFAAVDARAALDTPIPAVRLVRCPRCQALPIGHEGECE